ncbi:tetratricopeptide repeat protein [Planctomycetota bacterium]
MRGIVYLAQQEEPVRRQVALKVIKPGMDSKRVIARFEAEKQALALMQHPHIAGVYDAGLTLTGRPYFVMEHVKGTQITDYCDYHKLTIEDRLGLFVQVCQAVQHAHQKGIIHRDIKPSNILVSVENDRAIPKIIDFGVAKATGKPLTERTHQTEDTQLLGTPEYMSPEQADMTSEDIDTRSDVYSLGVLLYVLLTGVLPFESETLRDSGIENIRKTIRETDPKTPSTRLTKLGDEAVAIAQNRRMEIQTLARRLRKELEWIPLKAMRKERSERYRSASELADDIENYLKGAPLVAGPTTTLYRLKKFVRRNAMLSAAVLAVAVTLILGLAATTAMYFRAEGALGEATAVSDFLVNDILGDESLPDGQESEPDDMLDNATEKLEGKFEDQPLVEARIRNTLGQRYRSIGKSELARQQHELAYQINLQHLGPKHQNTLMTANMICWTYCRLVRHDDAIQLWTEQIEIIRRAYGEQHGLGLLFMMNIGQTYTYLGRHKEGEAWLDKVLELCKRSGSTRMPFVRFVASLCQGANYLAQGRYDQAEQVLSKVLEERQGSKDWRTLKFTTILSEVYKAQGQYGKAQQLCETTLDTMRQELGDKHSETLRTMCCLGRIYIDQGLFDEAEKLLREALKVQRLKLSDEHSDTLVSMNTLAVLLRKQKNYNEAEILFEEALEARAHILGDDHPHTLESNHELAVLYKEQARFIEAEKLLLEAVKGRILKLGDRHPHTQESLSNLIELYEAWNKPEKAEEWRAKLPKTEAVTK